MDDSITPRVGMLFEHARRLDTHWRPGPGQRYADAPPEVYRVTRVTSTRVYYCPAHLTKATDYTSPTTFHLVVKRVID